MQHLSDILTGTIDRNVVFGALVGVEMLFLQTRIKMKGVAIFWGILLPALMGAALLDSTAITLAAKVHATFLAPFLQTSIAAAGATGVLAMYRRLTKAAMGQDAELLLFASVTALLMMIPRWNTGNSSGTTALMYSAASLWLGWGIGLACFASLGGRLRGLAGASRFAGPFIFLSTLAIIALTIAALSGLQFGGAP